MSTKQRPIGIFDSGIGGLSVMTAIQQALPGERLLYFGDNAHIPYGDRSLREVRAFSAAIVRALLARGCKMVVIACNTASAAALQVIREAYPHTHFVGMEPALKPAAERSRSRVVGVIATRATFQGELFASVVQRFGREVEVLERPCPGLVQLIEAGELESPATERLLREWLEPMVAQGMDQLVLACTHYPFVRPLIQRICGPEVEVIDPAPAVARQVKRVLEEARLLSEEPTSGATTCYTSGDPKAFMDRMERLEIAPCTVLQADWSNGELSLP